MWRVARAAPSSCLASTAERCGAGRVPTLRRAPLRAVQDPAGDDDADPITPQGLPLIKPPYSRMTAYDLNTGTIAWQVPTGAGQDGVRSHPALAGLSLPDLGGQGGLGGALITNTLVIYGLLSSVWPRGSRRPSRRLRQGDRRHAWRGGTARRTARHADDLRRQRQAVRGAHAARRPNGGAGPAIASLGSTPPSSSRALLPRFAASQSPCKSPPPPRPSGRNRAAATLR